MSPYVGLPLSTLNNRLRREIQPQRFTSGRLLDLLADRIDRLKDLCVRGDTALTHHPSIALLAAIELS